MYRIRWRQPGTAHGPDFRVYNGLSRYATVESAQTQVDKFQRHWPRNRYYIERV